jgi:hypothetical protein
MFKKCVPFFVAICVLGIFSATASAQAGWEVTADTYPTYLKPAGEGVIQIRVLNIGAENSEGTVTVTDALPPGMTALGAGSGTLGHAAGLEFPYGQWDCRGNGPNDQVAGATVVTCNNDPVNMSSIPGGGGAPTLGAPLYGVPDLDPELFVTVDVPAGASEGTRQGSEANHVTVAGGGAFSSASTTDPVTISSSSPPFGFEGVDAWASNANGTVDTQAGSHPYEFTFAFDLNNVPEAEGGLGGNKAFLSAGGEVKDVGLSLPPGLVGNVTSVPQCPLARFDAEFSCPPDTQIGLAVPTVFGSGIVTSNEENGVAIGSPVYNIVPPAGEPAEFGFDIFQNKILIGAGVRSGSDYAITSQTNNITRTEVLSTVVTLWGLPSESSHNLWRVGSDGGVAGIPEQAPFLTLPTSCEGPQTMSVNGSPYEHPNVVAHASFLTHNSNDEPTGYTGCGSEGFEQAFSVAPDSSNADTPAGVTADLSSQLGGIDELGSITSSDIKDVTFTLPKGVSVNPGQAAGLQTCQLSESGIGVESALADPAKDEPKCPSASKVGTDEAETPLLEHPLKGNIYLLPSDPPHLLLLFALSGEGVNVKLIGRVDLNEATGQLVGHFGEPVTPQEEAEDPALKELKGHMTIPQAPVSDFKASFSGGAQAALSTPTTCGTYPAYAEVTPWATPLVGNVLTAGLVQIEHGTGGAPCPPSPLPYTPTLIAGSTTDQAGGYTDFSLLLQVPDDQQRTSRLQFKTPEGLLGMIAKIPLCHEQQANEGDCPEASQIGHTVVQAGPGPYPLVVPQPGQSPAPIYLTEGYEGAPYGLSIVVPIHVGPFTLPTQVVRAKIEVDPLTTQLTITTSPFPQTVGGVPTDLRTIDAVIDKPGFMFNPTGCSPRSFGGTAFGAEGAQAPIGSSFQMGSCRSLLFQPNFKVFTSAKTSRTEGASLGARIVYPTGDLGDNQASSQSNIRLVKVELPKRLPSRLTTLQKACTAAQFNANPAGCPAASVVGRATAITPVLPVPLTGPAYFVSNGGEAFPNLIIVLQGYGVTVHLVGDTFISKSGITSSTFKQVPDVPIASFELNLPEGPYSALAANGNLCKGALTMPTEFIGQNGAELHVNTKIEVQGCGKAKQSTKKHKKKTKRHTKRRARK